MQGLGWQVRALGGQQVGTQAGACPAVLRQNFFLFRESVLFLTPSAGGRVDTVEGPLPSLGPCIVALNRIPIPAQQTKLTLSGPAERARETPAHKGFASLCAHSAQGAGVPVAILPLKKVVERKRTPAWGTLAYWTPACGSPPTWDPTRLRDPCLWGDTRQASTSSHPRPTQPLRKTPAPVLVPGLRGRLPEMSPRLKKARDTGPGKLCEDASGDTRVPEGNSAVTTGH